ncbi:unnamed protein product [Clonostachys rhizophaga]|uniref:Uncharacterized protein n=1 Tax=Clonostachys rhizophaga TaxID=160324 RepID=A0A9N9YNK3_9HYPO|nr:unnamed protein product [Clonostachys rhizophaga]
MTPLKPLASQAATVSSNKDSTDGEGGEHDNSEARTTTSTGDVIVHPRDSNVVVLWGDCDDQIRWQSYALRLAWEMAKEKERSTKFTVNSVNDAGDVVSSIGPETKPEDLTTRPPVPPYALHRQRSVPGKEKQENDNGAAANPPVSMEKCSSKRA